jgi:hypothetical protein
MMGWLIFLAVIIGYLAAGRHLAKIKAPRMHRKAEAAWGAPSNVADSVKAQALCWLLLWPAMLIGATISDLGDHIVEVDDPKRLKRLIGERERRIKELEHELGIGDEG